jgi:hypothetical protein
VYKRIPPSTALMLSKEKNVPVPRAEIAKLVRKTSISAARKTPTSIIPPYPVSSPKKHLGSEKVAPLIR